MRFPSIFTAVLFAASSALAAPVNTTTEDETAQIPAEAVIGYSDLEGDFDVAVLPFSNSTNNGLLFINTTIASIAAKEEGVSLDKREEGEPKATPADWRSQSIYFLLTDRFARTDGSTTATCNTADRKYCGGTWQGIIDKLDYIQGMGFTAIWITPVTAQLPQTTAYGDAYHGYWQQDIYSLNENYGTADDLKALSSALHERGMYLMVDVVANHMGYDGAGSSVDYSVFKPFSSQDYFHPFCLIQNYEDQTQVEDCWLGDNTVSLPDLDTTKDVVKNEWYDWVGSLVSNYSIDGLRIDTVKHVQKDFWPGYNKAAGVYCIGEVLDGDPAYTCPYQNVMDGVLNYPIYYPLLNAFKSTSGSMDDLYNMINTVKSDCPDSTLLGTFVENHDNPRFASYTNDIALAKNVAAFIILNDGIPIIYAGQEQHYAGGNDPANREATWLSGYPTDSELYKLIASANAIRNYAISKDTGFVTYKNWPIYKDDTTIAMRKGTDGSQIVTILSNKGASGDSYTLSLSGAGYTAGQQLTEVIGCTTVTVGSDGNVPVPMAGGLPRVLYPTEKLAGSKICSSSGGGGSGGGGSGGGGSDAHKSEVAHRFKDLGEENFKALVLIAFAQYLQQCPFEDHVKLVNEVTEFAKTCVADESAENCDKSLHTLFGDKLCTVATLRETYGEMADCCAKQEPERNECFLQHKDDNPNLPRLVRPEVDVMCTAFHDNEETFLKKYLYEIARRHPYFYAPELLFFAKRYKAAFTECCQAADKAACLLPKLDELRDEGKASSAKQRLKCASLQKFGERAFKAWAVARLSQRFPKAEFAEVSKLVTDLTKVHTECCHGDLLECADDRADLAKYICENQDSISSKLKECCEKPLLEKSHCIAEVENDEMPADLPSLAADFVESKDVCKNYAEAKDVFLGMFLYEYARRHPDYSVVLLLRLAKTYETTLEKCCAAADPHECYAKVFDEFKPLVEEPQNLIKQNCELFEQLGEYKFQNALLVRYTKKVPQVSTPTLVEVSRNLGKVGSKCCKHPEAKRMPCAEDYLSVVLNQLCVLHEKTPVSDRVTKCCTESLVNRRPCFSALEVDETYVPKEFNAETFTFHADICTLSEKERQIKKQTALVELVKHKPKATKEQLKAVMDDFAAFVEKCCKADDKETCFAEEGKKLVAASQAALGLHHHHHH